MDVNTQQCVSDFEPLSFMDSEESDADSHFSESPVDHLLHPHIPTVIDSGLQTPVDKIENFYNIGPVMLTLCYLQNPDMLDVQIQLNKEKSITPRDVLLKTPVKIPQIEQSRVIEQITIGGKPAVTAYCLRELGLETDPLKNPLAWQLLIALFECERFGKLPAFFEMKMMMHSSPYFSWLPVNGIYLFFSGFRMSQGEFLFVCEQIAKNIYPLLRRDIRHIGGVTKYKFYLLVSCGYNLTWAIKANLDNTVQVVTKFDMSVNATRMKLRDETKGVCPK